MKNLVYLGVNKGQTFNQLVLKNKYDKFYGFEAIPEFANTLTLQHKSNPKVEIINAAVGEDNEPKVFYVQSTHGGNDGVASSLAKLSKSYITEKKSSNFIINNEVTVPGINLKEFLNERGITEIDTYISDIQGMDYYVLSTIKEFINNKKIKTIQVEAQCDYITENCYELSYPNNISTFHELLDENFEVVSLQQGGDWNPDSPTRWWHRDLEFALKK
tara:strand:- start:408 stop:1058 length:651 start_codon:yes stop_codon:yes gene_type:complete